MTATSDLIRERLSFGLSNLRIGSDDQQAVVTALQADRDVNATVRDLGDEGLMMVFSRMGNARHLCDATQAIAGRSTGGNRTRARGVLQRALRVPGHPGSLHRTSTWYHATALAYFDACGGLGDAARRHRFDGTAGCPAPSRSYAGRTSTSPFSGVGATGVNATTQSVPLTDQASMVLGDESVRSRYENPLGGLGTYLAALSPRHRLGQAQQLVCQPVSTIMGYVYRNGPPSRSLVMAAAGRLYRLEPALIAAIALAEQRDQTANEDAAEYGAAASILERNTSIGLTQVVVSTARRNDLFRDLGTTASSLDHKFIASLLASDDFSIFASAKYIRQVADQAARLPRGSQSRITSHFSGMDMAAYARHSRDWPFDNIRAIGMEYTSRPWDNTLIGHAWGDFVSEGYRTLSRGVSFP
ncbi:MAG: hypothetical protein ACE37F_03505 [Nannocystaceae bacterium]|nr:hypothetical protein [bacterium]